MKILELRFKNLNSLYGEWVVDFTNPEYLSNGIFALTGPTGAGKSTILDAICLALYGATPRLEKITQGGNEIMSRQTGECYAEVLFESQAGRFRCHWEQRRARKKADGNLQNPRHEITEGSPDGKVIENHLRRVQRAVEDKTGMDFDRFTRSILLAQGGFDTFLKANVEQKSKILEQITGTEIYSEISQRVHERRRDEQEQLKLLKAETEGIVILEPEEEKAIQLDLKANQIQETELVGKATETGKAIDWLNSIAGLENEISNLAEEAVTLQGDIKAFKPERDKLDRAIKAASLDGPYATLKAIRQQQSDDQTALKNEGATLPKLEASAKKQAKLLKVSKQQTLKAKKNSNAVAPLIRRVRSLDQELARQKDTVAYIDTNCKKDARKNNGDKRKRREEQNNRNQAGSNLEIADQHLKDHSQDKWLISGLAGVEEQLGNLLSKQEEINQKETNQKKAAAALGRVGKDLDKCRDQCRTRKQKLEEAFKKLQQGKATLNQLLGGWLLREYRDKKETLLREMTFLAKITELEDHRAKLKDGRPCPLCGAKEHPFAEGNVPEPDETEEKIEALTKLINKAEDQEAVIKKLEISERKAHKNLTESENLEAAAVNEKRNTAKDLTRLTNAVEKTQTEFTNLKQAVSVKLQPLGIEEIPDSDVSSLLESLRERLFTRQAQVEEKIKIEKQITDLDSDLNRLDAVIETQNSALAEKQQNLKTLKKEYSKKTAERQELYGDKKPDNEEARLNEAIADSEKAEKKARNRNSELQQELTTVKTHVESLEKGIGHREPKLKEAEVDFSSALVPSGFSDEKQFLEARLTSEQRDALSARAKVLDDGQTKLKAKQEDRETRLIKETARKVTGKTLAELEPQLKAYEASLQEYIETIAGLKHKLVENRAANERVKDKQTAIEAQKKECQRWEKLHGYIGSADGKKYRNFDQGLTFELMVSHANRQLIKMTNRYLLIRDDAQPLELNVVDNYQAGEIRSTKNLSGGESFIVSLTLALGLSKMASRKVRVDSLFLDEGFGTLDEEALETALETLSGLQQDGKLIGVISHVLALKKRISTQITIAPLSGGKSSLTGPGCNKIVRPVN